MKKKVTILPFELFKISNDFFFAGMRVLSLLLFTGLTGAYAYTSYAQTRIDINLKDATLEELFKEIQNKSDFAILYRDDIIEDTERITIKAKKSAVEDILYEALANTDLSFVVLDKQIVINKKKPAHTTQQIDPKVSVQQQINGTVTEKNGSPVPGVNVLVKETSRGVVTDFKGNFSIEADPDDILIFSFIGYSRQEIRVGNRTTIDVILIEDIAQLSEVVVTALGIEKDTRALSYSVGKVEGKNLTEARETNVANSLVGRIAGVNVGNVSGGPGSSSNVIIRGANSLNGSPPLYVINGVPIDNTRRGLVGQYGGPDLGDGIGNINPDDIDEITVLKGASAAALYGSRAAGGVIVIKTKNGKGQEGIGVEYNSNFTIDNVVDLTDYQYEYGHGLNGQKFTTQAEALSTLNSWGAKLDGSDVIQFDGVARPYVAQKNNLKNFYRTGSTFTNTVSISNSGDKGSLRFSASSLDNKAIIPNSGIDRTTFNLNTAVKITPKLTFDLLANYVNEKDKNRPFLNDGVLNTNFSVLFLPTSYDVRTLKPGYDPVTGNETLPWAGNPFFNNPWFVTSRFIENTSRNRFIGITGLRYNITNWLTAQARLGYDKSNDRETQVVPTGTGFLSGGYLLETFTNYRELNADFLLSASKDISSSISISGNIGGNIRKNEAERLLSEGSNFSVPFLYTLSNTSAGKNSNYSLIRSEVQSLYYSAEVSYKNMLYLNTTGRQDWFSVLDGRTIFYPSAGVGFVFSDLLKWPTLSYGKLRSSWAQTTSDPTSLVYQTSLYYNLSGIANGVPLGQISNEAIPNRNISPNKITEVETGIELRFFKNRLGVDFAYYNRQVKDEPLNITTSVTSGYSAATLNVGTLENKGFELLITGTPIKTTYFSWNASVNYTKNNNKVKSLNGDLQQITVAQSRPGQSFIAHVVDKPAAQVMAFDYQRDDNGNILFDEGGLPVQGELIPLGSGIQPVFGGINNEFKYKGLSLSFLIDFKSGGKIYSGTNYFALRYGFAKETLVGREGGVIGAGVSEETGNPNTISVVPATYYDQLAKRISSVLVYDASFVKLRQIILGYDLPANLLKGLPVQSVSFSLIARNVAILKKHTPNVDPEGSYNPSLSSQGLEQAGVPYTRSYGFNVNIKF